MQKVNIIDAKLEFGSLTKRTKTDRIIVHNADAKSCTPQQIHAWHRENGWSGAGYHFLVRKDGTIYSLRPEDKVGAHASGCNGDSIGICFEGAYEVETKMPDEQLQAGRELIAYLKDKYGITKVQRHNQVNSTDCPGKHFPWCALTASDATSAFKSYKVRVTASALNMRAGAGTSYKVVKVIKKGTRCNILAEKNGWGKCKAGWICLSYTRKI